MLLRKVKIDSAGNLFNKKNVAINQAVKFLTSKTQRKMYDFLTQKKGQTPMEEMRKFVFYIQIPKER